MKKHFRDVPKATPGEAMPEGRHSFVRAAVIAAILCAAAFFLSEAGGVFGEVGEGGSCYRKRPFRNRYLMFRTEEGSPYTCNYEGVYDEFVQVFSGMYEALSLWTGGRTEEEAAWGEAWPWVLQMRGIAPVSDLAAVPKWFNEGAGEQAFSELWDSLASMASSGDGETVLATLAYWSEDRKNYYYSPELGGAEQWYLKYTCGYDTPIMNGYYTDDGGVAYCLQWNEEFPLGETGEQAEDPDLLMEKLGIEEEQYEKLRAILQRGYPLNRGIGDTPFADFPEEALQEGTQAALWAYLGSIGAVGNTGTGGGGSGTIRLERMENLTDPLLNPDGGAYDVLAYVRYLLCSVPEELVPSAGLQVSESPEYAEKGAAVYTLKVRGQNADGGMRIGITGFPEGSVLLGKNMEEIREGREEDENGTFWVIREGFNAGEAEEETFYLRFPLPEEEGIEAEIRVEALSFMNEAVPALLFTEHPGSQVMALLKLRLNERVAGAEAVLELPYTRLLFRKQGTPQTFEGDYREASRREITPVLPGEELTYTMEISNTGTAPVFGILLRDKIPEHTAFGEVYPITLDGESPAEGKEAYREEEGEVRYFLPELLPGETMNCVFTVYAEEEGKGERDIVNFAEYCITGRTSFIEGEDLSEANFFRSPEVVHRILPEETVPETSRAETVTEPAPEPPSSEEPGEIRPEPSTEPAPLPEEPLPEESASLPEETGPAETSEVPARTDPERETESFEPSRPEVLGVTEEPGLPLLLLILAALLFVAMEIHRRNGKGGDGGAVAEAAEILEGMA